MYIIKYTAVSGEIAGIPEGEIGFFPLDRCVFATIESTTENAYMLDNNVLEFYPGDNPAIDLNVTGNIAELGVLGKSGRFVGTTQPRTL